MDHLVLIGEVGVKAACRHDAKTGQNKRHGLRVETKDEEKSATNFDGDGERIGTERQSGSANVG